MARRAARVRRRARRRSVAPRAYRRRRSRGSALIPGEWGSVIAGGGVALLGGLVLSKFFVGLPAWLSPAGVALWFWGWWRNVPVFRWTGMFLIALAVASFLGITSGIDAGVTNAMAKLRGLGGGAGGGGGQTVPTGGGGAQPSSDVQQAVSDLTAALNLYQTAQQVFA